MTAAETLATFLMWRFDLTADEAAGLCVTMTPIARREAQRMAGVRVAPLDQEALWEAAQAHLAAA